MTAITNRRQGSRLYNVGCDFVFVGDNSSLYMPETNRPWKVETAILVVSQDSVELALHGISLDIGCYTDRQIEQQVEQSLKSAIELKLGKSVTAIRWSEYGMQQHGTWSFDVEVA